MRGRRVDAYFEFSAASFSSLSSLEVRVQMARWRRRYFKNNSGFEEVEVVRQCSGAGGGTHLMMHSGIWMQSMGMSFCSSSKLATYCILLLNLALWLEGRCAQTHTLRTGKRKGSAKRNRLCIGRKQQSSQWLLAKGTSTVPTSGLAYTNDVVHTCSTPFLSAFILKVQLQ